MMYMHTNTQRWSYFLRTNTCGKCALFVLFTIFYIHIALRTLPRKHYSTAIAIKNNNITSKIITKMKETSIDLYAVEEEMAARRELQLETCKNLQLPAVLYNTVDFVVDTHHALVWCKAFRVASSTWIYYFNVLGSRIAVIKNKVCSNLEDVILSGDQTSKRSVIQLTSALRSSLSFLITRDPLERLLSIYLNILFPDDVNPIRNFEGNARTRAYRSLLKNSSVLSFKEFVKYVLLHDNQNNLWAPITRSCSPCFVNFTVIAKFETLQDDQEYIIRRAGLEDAISLPEMKLRQLAHERRRLKRKPRKYFAQLDRGLLESLIEVYRADFEMFGYNATKYYEFLVP